MPHAADVGLEKVLEAPELEAQRQQRAILKFEFLELTPGVDWFNNPTWTSTLKK